MGLKPPKDPKRIYGLPVSLALVLAALLSSTVFVACDRLSSSDDVDQAVKTLDLATRGVSLNDQIVGTIMKAKSKGPMRPADVAPLKREAWSIVRVVRKQVKQQEAINQRLLSALRQQAGAIDGLVALARANNRGSVTIQRARTYSNSISRALVRSQRGFRRVIRSSLLVFEREGQVTPQSQQRLNRIQASLAVQTRQVQSIRRQETIVAKAADVEEPEITTQALSPPPGWTDCGLLQFSVSWAFRVYANSNYCVQAEVIIQQAGDGGILDATPGTQVPVAPGFCTRLSTDPAKPQFECQVEGGFELIASWPDGAGPS